MPGNSCLLFSSGSLQALPCTRGGPGGVASAGAQAKQAVAGKLALPRAESPTHFITLGLDVDLDDAAKQALRTMLDWLVEMTGLPRQHAYSLCSFICDLHVTQTVNNVIGIHAMIEKKLLEKG